jgi:hypothetical protein
MKNPRENNKWKKLSQIKQIESKEWENNPKDKKKRRWNKKNNNFNLINCLRMELEKYINFKN